MSDYRRNELNAAFWSGGWLLGLAFLFSFFVTLLMLTNPIFMLLIYDRVLAARSQETLAAIFGLVVALLVLMALFDYSRGRILARFGARLQERLEARVLAAVEARAARGRTGGAPTSGTRELDGLRAFFHSSALLTLLDFAWAPVFLAAVFVMHPLLGWVALIGVLLLFAVAILRAVFSAHLVEDADAASGAVGRISREIQQSQNTILAHGMAGPAVGHWLAARAAARDTAIVLNDRVSLFTVLTRHMRLLFQVTVLAMGAHLVMANRLTVGGMVACFILLVRVFAPVEQFLRQLPAIRQAREHWRALDAILKAAPAYGPAEAAESPGGGLAVRDLSVRRRGSQGMLLDGVSFAVKAGEVVQITGGAGAGKTTLARALLGQTPIASGSVVIGGRNIDQFGAEEIGRLVGYLPETVGFYPGTILRNIARLAPDPQKPDVVSAAKRAGAHAMISGLPRGYMTVVESDGTPLSMGQRRRVALARALYGKPSLIVLDEPSGVQGLLSRRPGGPAIVVLAREPRDMPLGTRHYRLENGTLVEAGKVRMATRAGAETTALVVNG
jgi:ATP-binding cassette, subfamily C, type I secretion system permease/ATPase